MRSLLVTVAAAGMLTLAACGSSDDKSKTASLTVSETSPTKGKFAFEGLKSIPAGPVKIEFSNDVKGKTEHELQLVRVTGNHTGADVLKLVMQDEGPTPEWLNAAGGVSATKAGGSGTTTEVLPPGKYYAFDTGGGDENGPSPAEKGALAAFEVTGKAKSAELPKSTANVTAKDKGDDEFSFETSGLKVGNNTLEFVNDSKKELHHVIGFPLLPGKTVADAKKAFASNGPPQGPPPVDFESGFGTSVLNQKTKEVTDLKISKPGNYVLVCFLSDRDGKGKRHFAEGMLKEADAE